MNHRSTTRSRLLLAVALTGTLTLAACGGSSFDEGKTPTSGGTSAGGTTASGTTASGSDNATGTGDQAGETSAGTGAPVASGLTLNMLIGSSGEAETNAVKAAADAWGKQTGNTVTVTAATDLNQELAQGFAGGNPPDIFYLDASKVADQAKAGNLYAYTAENNDDFYESLRTAFTVDGTQQCAPKDFSTLALEINTKAWTDAGLTDADIPKTYEDLTTVAGKLTKDGQVGLALSPGIDRSGAFVVGNGGWWLNADNTAATANTPEVVAGLKYVQDGLKSGSFALSSDLDTGWGGEAFGTGKAAMTLEGNWIKGAMKNDYPDVDYKVVELPPGPAGPGTLLFSNCWGVAAQSKNQDAAVNLVNFLTAKDQQMAFADAFGVMPSRQSAAEDYKAKYPEDAAFIAGGAYGHGPINAAGMTDVVADLNSQMETLKDADIAGMLDSFDTNAAAALGQ